LVALFFTFCSEYVPEIQAKYADTMVAGWK
jgi:hypothetical protein